MLQAILLILVPLGILTAGLVVLWLQSRTSTNGWAAVPDGNTRLVSVIAWTLVIVALFAVIGLMAGILFVPAWIILAAILLSLLYRYRSAERRSLLWTLMLAAEHEIPLDTAARAFASERRDHIGQRALDLAEYLEAGLPLSLALRRSRLHYPHSVLLSAELGQQTGDLGGALRRTLGTNNESEQILRTVAERTFYLIAIVLFGSALVTFMMMKIVPAFQKILDEFGMQTPAALQFLVSVSHVLFMGGPLFLVVIIVLVFFMLRGLSYYTGSSARYMPGMSAGWNRSDRSVIMHWLAHAVRQSRPLPEMMRLMSGYLTKRRLRNKLQWTARRIDQGVEWTECLLEAGIIRRPEAAVFHSAERTGNLAWALDEMAESIARRSVYRLRAVTNVAFPVTVAALGSFVLLIAFAMLSPLFNLIVGLS